MSDFDKEAEREKLRERFEAEEEDRAVTEQMSELLLQGATMTNRHCDACHSPIFTYQGQSFCPTCQVEVGGSDGETAAANASDAAPTDPASADAGSDRQSPTDGDSRSATRIEVDDPGNGADTRGPGSPESNASPEPAPDPAPKSDATASAPTAEPAPSPPTVTDATGQTAGTGDTDLAAAQVSLSRTLSRLSQQAERSEDLSRTRDYLLAAQEAAEALTALKQARR